MSRTHLLELSGGSLSLEVASEDRARVAGAIRRLYGEPEIEVSSPFTYRHRFGGADFTFMDENDDPCLISNSEQGNAVLRKVFAALNSS